MPLVSLCHHTGRQSLAGWHAFLDQLEGHLKGETRPDRFKELETKYKEAFDPAWNATKDLA